MVEVTQEDREAARDVLAWIRGMVLPAPHDGHWLTQAFARHREAAVKAEREACAKVAEGNRTDDGSMWDRAGVIHMIKHPHDVKDAGRDTPAIEVTPAMVAAGLDELREHRFGGDLGYVLENIFRAMHYAARV